MANHLKKRKIGIYGGTFDPIHFGHINLAVEMKEAHALDEIWFCPAYINPHKQSALPIVSVHHRLEMLKLAIEDLPYARVLDIEAKRKGPSYTVDTLHEILNNNKNTQFFLILGDDSIREFYKWHKAEEIIKLVTVVVGARELKKLTDICGSQELVSSLKKGLTPTSIIQISSTQIRDRLNKNLYCGHLLPAKVLDYIYQNKLYSSPR